MGVGRLTVVWAIVASGKSTPIIDRVAQDGEKHGITELQYLFKF
jgi:hypothetical protein